MAGLGQKSSVLGMSLYPNGPKASLNWISKVDNMRREPTVLIYILWFMEKVTFIVCIRIRKDTTSAFENCCCHEFRALCFVETNVIYHHFKYLDG